jgi:hypothetical protein
MSLLSDMVILDGAVIKVSNSTSSFRALLFTAMRNLMSKGDCRDEPEVEEEQNRHLGYMFKKQAWTINQWALTSPDKETFRRI